VRVLESLILLESNNFVLDYSTSTRVLCAALQTGLLGEMRSSVNCTGQTSIRVVLQRQQPTARADAFNVAMLRSLTVRLQLYQSLQIFLFSLMSAFYV